jgi:hypothetical protein
LQCLHGKQAGLDLEPEGFLCAEGLHIPFRFFREVSVGLSQRAGLQLLENRVFVSPE